MARPLRSDHPGALHHVTNRGHGHRVLFNGSADIAVFLGLLERAALERALRVHSYCIVGTHFHLIVSTADGSLYRSLGWVQDMYARYFNRTRDRDGHVMKGRYFARRIDDQTQFALTVSYIDHNPVAAGIVDHPGAYPHGSARYYLQAAGPAWLRRDLVEALVRRVARSRVPSSEAYLALWKACAASARSPDIGRAMGNPRVQIAPIGRLLEAGPAHVQEWLAECARREEGARGLVVALGVVEVQAVVERVPMDVLRRLVVRGAPAPEPRRALEAALLHTLAGRTLEEVATLQGRSRSGVSADVACHRSALLTVPPYAAAVALHVRQELDRAYAGLPRGSVRGASRDVES